MSVQPLTEKNFIQQVRNRSERILIDFWAHWCTPCRMLAPVLEQVSQEMPDAKIYKINVDECPALASEFGINSIPTLIVYEHDNVVQTEIGMRSKDAIVSMLQG